MKRPPKPTRYYVEVYHAGQGWERDEWGNNVLRYPQECPSFRTLDAAEERCRYEHARGNIGIVVERRNIRWEANPVVLYGGRTVDDGAWDFEPWNL